MTKTRKTTFEERVAMCIDNGPMEGFWGVLTPMEKHYSYPLAA